MFTEKAQAVIDRAKDYAFSEGASELTLKALCTAMSAQAETGVLLSECMGLTPEKLRALCSAPPSPASCPGKLPLHTSTRAVLAYAKALAEEVPDRLHPGLIDIRHLVCALATSHDACALMSVTAMPKDRAIALLGAWYEQQAAAPKLDELTEQVRMIRAELLACVFGQDHAVHAFCEGLFNAEVVAAADTQRRAPKAIFVFAGPPGVGKTYVAERGASLLKRPFRRFDMTAYSGHQQNEQLVGMSKSFSAAHPGVLTEFVEKNPNAILLFDEIEKAHANTIHLFLQILDAGTLEDKFHERNVSFRDMTIIFTTNAGRKLYDKPNESGVHAANASFHRKTILDALQNEQNPQTREPFFPQAMCSRMATGYPVLFNHLRVNELERVANAELLRVGWLLERQYYKRVSFEPLLPMCLVLREGARSDARTLRSQVENFVKTELFKFCQLFKTDRLEEVFGGVDRVAFGVAEAEDSLPPGVRDLFEPQGLPRILLVAEQALADLCREHIRTIDWRTAATPSDAMETLANEELDMVLLDLWLGGSAKIPSVTVRGYDHVPAAARGLEQGQELLRKIRERVPGMPVYLLSLVQSEDGKAYGGTVDDELFLACVRGGGARGLIASRFTDGTIKGWEGDRDQFAASLVDSCRRLHREKAAARMGQERKVLTFDTVPRIEDDQKLISIRLRNFRLSRAIAAADAGEVLDDVERPRTRFDDVIGANAAKDELTFFIDYLKNPRRFSALGLKPPKGVLLHGPPGTGKTMLARAMAGESEVSFLAASASSFVTMWQGSGPQSIRDLFARARRYAPAILFIDEIDSIGRVRTGSAGSGRAEEETLNALLTEMDGFTGSSTDQPVFVLAATNFNVEVENEKLPERSARALDPALVRRFSRCILVDLPDTTARRKYFVLRLTAAKSAKISESVIDLLSEKSAGMSIANIEQVFEAAGRKAMRGSREMTDDILVEALDTVREGEAKEWSPQFLESTARHEAGHTIMYWLAGWWSPEVSIIARADHGGGMRRSEEEIKRESVSREDLLASIRTTLGGRAAEMLYYGGEGVTTGASGDLEHASLTARQMLCRYGMDEEFGILAMPELFKYAEAMGSPAYQRVNEAANRILNDQMLLTKRMLEENRQHLDAVAKALLARNRLYRKDLEAIMPAIAGGSGTAATGPHGIAP